MMPRSLFTAVVICAWYSVSAQSTLVVITDLYQDALSYDSDISDRVISDITELVTSHDGPVFSFYCDDSGSHYAFRKQNVLAHLDSITNKAISPPIESTSWNVEGISLVRKLIKLDASFDSLTLCLFTTGELEPDFQSEFLFPLSHVINRIDQTGQIDSRLSVQVHSYGSLDTDRTTTTITNLR